MKLLLCRRGWSATGGAERYLQRFAAGLDETGIQSVLVADGKWPGEAWNGNAIERLGNSDIAGEIRSIRDRHPGAVLFSTLHWASR